MYLHVSLPPMKGDQLEKQTKYHKILTNKTQQNKQWDRHEDITLWMTAAYKHGMCRAMFNVLLVWLIQKRQEKTPCIKRPWRFNFHLTSRVLPLPNERQTSPPLEQLTPPPPHCLGSVLKSKIKGEHRLCVSKNSNLIPSRGQAPILVGPREDIIFF